MREWMRIKCRYEERVVDAILLCIYKRDYYRFKKSMWDILLFRKTKSKIATKTEETYLVFIPWKHREKQLCEIAPSNALPFEKSFPTDWIFIPEFVSNGTEEFYPSVTVKNFSGYRFICENNSFICDQACGEYEANLEILYSEFPELLDEEFDEDIF